MTIADQIANNLVNPEKHGPIVRALLRILEEDGEKGLKDHIAQWIREIQDEIPADTEKEA
jgi:hypothetical protein